MNLWRTAWVTQDNHLSKPDRTVYLPVILMLIFLCLFLPATGLTGTAPKNADQAAVRARQLLLEGTQLQLRGKLEDAVARYRQSLALKPDKKLEDLVSRLERHIAVSGRPGQVQKTGGAASQSLKPGAEAETGTLPKEIQGHQVLTEEARKVVHHLASPDEQLVYDFVDWTLSEIDSLVSEDNPDLLNTNRDFKVTKAGDAYNVRLDPFVLQFDQGRRTIDMGPVIMVCQPRSAEILAVNIEIPARILFLKQNSESFAIVTGQRRIWLMWNRQQKSLVETNVDLSDIGLDAGNSTSAGENKDAFSLKRLVFHSKRKEGEGGQWTDAYTGSLTGAMLAADDNKGKGTIDSISFSVVGNGTDLMSYQKLKEQYRNLLREKSNFQVADLKDLSRTMDSCLQSFISSEGKIDISGVRLENGGKAFFVIDHADYAETMVKEKGEDRFSSEGNGIISSIVFREPDGTNPVSFKIGEVTSKNIFRTAPVPPALFSDIFDKLDKAANIQDKTVRKKFLSKEGPAVIKTVLSLISTASSKITVKGIKAENLLESPVILDQAAFGAGFDTGTGNGGTIHISSSFSGFRHTPGKDDVMPEAAAVNMQIANIPSLLMLINNPDAIVEGGLGQLQDQVMMNGMNTLLDSKLSFTLLNSFIAFPAARINVALHADINKSARYKSVGQLELMIENPDEIKTIINKIIDSPSVHLMLAGFTALANRKTENGKTVDQLDIRLTPSGKIMLNNKDVTALFFSQTSKEQSKQSPGAAQPPVKNMTQAPVRPANPEDKKLSMAEQKELAGKLFKEMGALDTGELERFENDYLTVIRRCPDTDYAQAAYFRLANMYLYAYENPDYQRIIALLEPFPKRYPNSKILKDITSKLVRAYEETKNYAGVEHVAGEYLKKHNYSAGALKQFGLDYGRALEQHGHNARAVEVYQMIVDKGTELDEFTVNAARKHIQELQKK